MSVHGPLIRSLLASPLRKAITDDTRTYRSAELLAAAFHVATRLETISESATVGVLTPTGAAFPICALASWMLGRTVVPLNYLLKKEELQYVIDDCGTDTVLTVKPMLDFMGYTPKVKNVELVEAIDFKALPMPRWPARAEDDDLAVLLYTSGTSGKPKGVMLTHANITANIRQVDSFIALSSDDVVMGVLPQFHSFGMTVLTLLPLTLGFKAVFTARFIPHRLIKLFREHRPTMFIAIPSMFGAMLQVKDAHPEDFASLRLLVSGGEPLPDAVASRFYERFGVRINEGYGLTETSPVTNWCRPDEYTPHSVGKPLPEIEQRIYDINTGRTLPPGEEGEVQLRGPNVMKGYYKLPEQTGAAFTPDGFFRTGDIGRTNLDGHLFITGRLKEMLIIGGENVFPREIEEVLNRHPSVAASGVIGIKDPVRGELPVAFVEINEGHAFDEKVLLQWCRQSLAGYKVPSEIRGVPQLPRNPTGKIMRRELKNLL